jgi:histidyl-tRNA synthetase
MLELFSYQNYENIIFDSRVVRGLGYYTGSVYEAELTYDIIDEKGNIRQFGSIAGGGRYDGLIKRFTGQEVPSVGVSVGVDRLLAAMKVTKLETGPVVVSVMDRDRISDYMDILRNLRNAGIRSELYLGNPKNFGNQIKYADNRNSPVAVIRGTEEFSKGTVIIKDLIKGKKLSQTATLDEWKENPSQIEVPLVNLVFEIQKLLRT